MAERSSRLVRSFAFVGKEIKDVARQPRLILTLIVGPFLILLLFGLGYRPTPPPLHTLLVTSDPGPFVERVQTLQDLLSDALVYDGTTPDIETATRRLQDGDVDLVVVAPPGAEEVVARGEHAEIRILHNRIDPFDRAYIEVLAQTAVDQLNRLVLEDAARQVQQETGEVASPVSSAHETSSALVDALERGDEEEARRQQDRLAGELVDVQSEVESGAGATSGTDREAALQQLEEARAETDRLDPSSPTALGDAVSLEQSLSEADRSLSSVGEIDPGVLVQPFTPETTLLAPVEIPLQVFYAPGVIAVLIQHIAVTFAALSIVRDRRLGITEVFRVSPISTGEIIFGKYVAYLLVGFVVAAVLTLVAVFGLGVPMLGQWWLLAAIMALTTLASLALGFVLSAFSRSDTQAVQYAMIVLLVTIFFSGFVISLDRLHPAATVVSFLVPARPAIDALQSIMFRGVSTVTWPLVILGAYVAVGTAIAWAMTAARLKSTD